MSQPTRNTTLVTGVQPPAPWPTSPPQNTMMLSPGELAIMFQTGNFAHQITQAFDDNSTTSMTLWHFCFLSFSIQQLEFNVEWHWQEQEGIFSPLVHHQQFHKQMEPLVAAYRRQARTTWNHPYSCTPSPISTPSNPQSHDPPSSDEPQPITCQAQFQNVRFVGSPSMSLPTRNTSYHTAPEGPTKIDLNNFLMQQPPNKMGPPIRRGLYSPPPIPRGVRAESKDSPRTKFGHFLAEPPANFKNLSPNFVLGQSEDS